MNAFTNVTIATIHEGKLVMTDESHHPDCPAIDGLTCRCAQLAALSSAYAERGLEDRTKPIRALPTFDGWTDQQIASYIESN
jgi:hypothetical protein